jgi:ribosomal protein S1
MLSRTERYLGTVKKLADYGAFVSFPAGADGLLRGSEAGNSLSLGEFVIVEIVDMPYGKPIALTRISR